MLESESRIKKARAVYHATCHLRLSELPPLDYTDRISLLTVTEGLRPVGVLEGHGLELSLVKDAVINNGLFTWVAKTVWTARNPILDSPRAELLAILHRQRNSKQPDTALWLYSQIEDRKRWKGVELTKVEAGMMLSYPECCVRACVDEDLVIDYAFLDALIAKVGDDPLAIEKAIRENTQVDISEKLKLGANVPKTSETFPFVIHVACDACLSMPGSPSAILNQTYQSFIQEVDPAMHDAVMETGRLLVGFEECENKGQVIAQVEELHYSLFGF